MNFTSHPLGMEKNQTLLTLSVSKDLSLWSNAAILLQGHKNKAFVTHRKSAQCVQFKVQMCCVFPLLVRSWRTAPVLRQPWMPKFGDLNISDSMKEQILLYRLRLSAIFFKWINHLPENKKINWIIWEMQCIHWKECQFQLIFLLVIGKKKKKNQNC